MFTKCCLHKQWNLPSREDVSKNNTTTMEFWMNYILTGKASASLWSPSMTGTMSKTLACKHGKMISVVLQAYYLTQLSLSTKLRNALCVMLELQSKRHGEGIVLHKIVLQPPQALPYCLSDCTCFLFLMISERWWGHMFWTSSGKIQSAQAPELVSMETLRTRPAGK